MKRRDHGEAKVGVVVTVLQETHLRGEISEMTDEISEMTDEVAGVMISAAVTTSDEMISVAGATEISAVTTTVAVVVVAESGDIRVSMEDQHLMVPYLLAHHWFPQ